MPAPLRFVVVAMTVKPENCYTIKRSRREGRQLLTTTGLTLRDFVLMKSSTKDKIKGGFREAKGKVKEKAGNTTGNPNLRDRGTAEKAGGKLQRKVGDLKKVFEQ